MKVKIRVGDTFTIREVVHVGNGGVAYKTKRLRVVARYTNVVLMENEKGVRECFTPWELERCVV